MPPAPVARRPASNPHERRWRQARDAYAVALDDLAAARKTRTLAAARRDAAHKGAVELEQRLAQAEAEAARYPDLAFQSENPRRAGERLRIGYRGERRSAAVTRGRLERLRESTRDARAAAAAATASVHRADDAVRAARVRCEKVEAVLASVRRAPRIATSVASPDRPPRPLAPRPAAASAAEVRAPSGGVVSYVTAAPGATVDSGQILLSLASATGGSFRAEGPADRLRGVRAGTPCRLRVGGKAIDARVRAVTLLKDRRNVAIDVVPAYGSQALFRRRPAAVELEVPSPAPVLTVPAPAVRHTDAGPIVWVARRSGSGDSWTAHPRGVRLGAARDGKIAIRDGLVPGSRVIVAGMERLNEGQPVVAVPWTLP